LIKVLHTNFYTAAAVAIRAISATVKNKAIALQYCIHVSYLLGSLVLSMTGLPYTTIAIKEIN